MFSVRLKVDYKAGRVTEAIKPVLVDVHQVRLKVDYKTERVNSLRLLTWQ